MTRLRLVSLVVCGLVSDRARADDACTDAIRGARGLVVTGQTSMESGRLFHERARDAVAAIPPSCWDSTFYALVAALLAQPENHDKPLKVATTTFARARDALDAGLKLTPNSPELLALVAHWSLRPAGDKLALPGDACARVRDLESPLARYVCGVAALEANQFADASKQFARIPAPARLKFPDLDSLVDRAAHRGTPSAGKPKPVKLKLACDPFCP